MLDQLPVQAGCFYVLDRGYLGFAVQASHAVDKRTVLRCDQTIALTNPHSKRSYPQPLRRVRVYDAERKKSLVLLTNHFEIPAQSVAELYKRRWQIELFFKWIKQHLRVRGFLGTSPNAVQCQLWSALCTYLLVAILKKELKLDHSLHEILQILSLHPFEQHPITELLTKSALEENETQQQNLFDINYL
jgi:transposase